MDRPLKKSKTTGAFEPVTLYLMEELEALRNVYTDMKKKHDENLFTILRQDTTIQQLGNRLLTNDDDMIDIRARMEYMANYVRFLEASVKFPGGQRVPKTYLRQRFHNYMNPNPENIEDAEEDVEEENTESDGSDSDAL